MKRYLSVLFVAWTLCLVRSGLAEEKKFTVDIPPENEILQTLRKERPRLFVLKGEEDRVNTAVPENERLAGIYRRIVAAGDKMAHEEPIAYELTLRSQPTLKPKPGRAMDRIVTLATLYRLTKEKKYFDRAVLEMTTVCNFPDWNHKCFLDTELLATGVAVGYDWLYHDLTPEQRTLFRNALRDKALLPGMEAYDNKVGWTRSIFNWNQACAGGLTVAALAIADEEPELAARILHRTCTGVQRAMTEFAPDGGTREGPGYWSFAVNSNVLMLAALDTALGTDFGLSRFPGFADTGRFRTHFVTPLKTAFAYGDAQPTTGASWAMHWLARKFDRPAYAWQDRTLFEAQKPWDLWWAVEKGDGMDEPTSMHFLRAGLVFMRSSWQPDAVYVAIKAGTNAAGHSHLELGHFTLVGEERHWIGDLGSPVHYTNDYFKKDRRWTYLQASNLSHNIPHIDGKLQNVKGVTPVTLFETSPKKTVAELDLTDAYKGQVETASRRFTLEGKVVIVEDSFRGVVGETFTWQVHSPARSVVVDEKNPRLVKLQHHMRRMWMEILEPADAVFELDEIAVPEGQTIPKGMSRVVLRRKVGAEPIEIKVRFRPQPEWKTKK